jgi:predicted ATP-grasp superfamily ATP-dependent carboligase
MARVLILDGSQRSALAAVRSLGRRLEAVVAEEASPCLAGRSRFAAGLLRYPPPATAPGAFQEWLVAECQRGSYEMVLPLTDLTVPLVLPRRAEIEPWARLPFVSLETYERASDKPQLLALAAELGLPVPRSLSVARPGELDASQVSLRYPLVVKPQRSKTPLGAEVLSAGAAHASSPEELARLLAAHPVLSRVPVLIQEKVEGEGVGLFALCQEGRPVRLFAHRRLMEKPPSGGVSVLCESIPLDPQVRELALRLLEALNWHGAAMVEFRQGRDGVPYLMEINARFWGSLQLAVDCGLDFPYDLYLLARGERLDLAESHYRVGRRCRWLLGCLDHYYLRLKTGQLLRTSGQWSSKWGETSDFVFRRDDPGPFFWELRSYLGAALGLRR